LPILLSQQKLGCRHQFFPCALLVFNSSAKEFCGADWSGGVNVAEIPPQCFHRRRKPGVSEAVLLL